MQTQDRMYFDSFREVVKAVNSTLDRQEVLDLLVSNVAQVMGLKACAIRMLHGKKRTLELLASHGLSERYINKGSLEADKSIADAMEGETVSVYNATEDPRIQYPKEAKEEGISSMISVPLSCKGQVKVGALAIENARMHEAVKEDNVAIMSEMYDFVSYRRRT
jgi:signal transduction protein with GAF and PtsI domain